MALVGIRRKHSENCSTPLSNLVTPSSLEESNERCIRLGSFKEILSVNMNKIHTWINGLELFQFWQKY